jgi:ribosome-binding factor A
MPRVSSRVDKVADLLKKEIALLIQNEIRDPRVGMASVTGVKVSKDLAHANVFVTMMGKSSEQEAADGIAALNKASGYLRTLLAKTISLRTIPKLKFIFDDSLARGEYLTGLIDEALARDLRDHHLEDDEDSH